MNTEELSNRLTQILTLFKALSKTLSKTSTYTLNENIANTNPIIHISQWKPISNT